MRLGQRILCALAAVLFSVTASAQDTPYRTLDTPQPSSAEDGRVEVLEFFSYACPHCNSFRPELADWANAHADVAQVTHVPVTFGRERWRIYAQAYYVAEVLGILEETHAPFFSAIHDNGRRFGSPEEVADFYASLGVVERDEALSAFDSFSVSMKLRRAEQMAKDYGIRSTPTLAVAGRYVLSVRSAGGQGPMLESATSLVQRHSDS